MQYIFLIIGRKRNDLALFVCVNGSKLYILMVHGTNYLYYSS